jgi:hypothetical protein
VAPRGPLAAQARQPHPGRAALPAGRARATRLRTAARDLKPAHRVYYAPGQGFVELTGWKLHDERAIDAVQCFPHVCYLDDNVGHVYRFDDPAPGSPHWTYLGSIGETTFDPFGRVKVFQVASDQSVAYLGTTRGNLFRMDLKTGKATGPLDLWTLDSSFNNLQLYGFDAWDQFGRLYFSAFGPRNGPRNARLVAVDPAQLPFQ